MAQLIDSAPVFSCVLEWLLWKIRPTKVWGMATVMAIIGCVLLFINNRDEQLIWAETP